MKAIAWVGTCLAELRQFPAKARHAAAYQLFRVQCGLEPDDWRPMHTIGPGVTELRIHAEGEHRAVYVAKFEEVVYVLHAFVKKERRTTKRHIQTAARRYRGLIESRKT